MHHILLVEDEEHLQETIKLNLELEGYNVTALGNGKKGLDAFSPGAYSLVILDVMLPDMDGFTICEGIRKQDQQVPVLFLTAKNTGEDRIAGLKKGADDYLGKPFNLEELLLRVSNLIKRSTVNKIQAGSETYKIDDFIIYFNSYEIHDSKGKLYELTKKEMRLLKLLIDKKGEAVSRDIILEYVWGDDKDANLRTIDNIILNFRKYFNESPRNPNHFHSVRGVGYKYTD